MLKDLLNVFIREWKSLIKNKRLLVILLIIPIIYTLFFSYMYDAKVVKNLKLGVVDYKPTQLTRDIINSFDKSERFIVKKIIANEQDIPYLIEKGEIDGALIFPEDFTRNVKKGEGSSLFVAANGANMVISNNVLTGATEIMGNFDASIVVKKHIAEGDLKEIALKKSMPITMTLRPWFNPTNSYFSFFLLGLIATVIQQTTFLGAAVTVTSERKEKTLAEIIKNVKYPSLIVIGKIFTYISVAAISTVVCYCLLFKTFHMPQNGNYLDICILSLAFLFCICTLGVFLSIICKNSLESIQYSMIVALPSFLLSGYTWPLEAMPNFIAFLGKLLPLTYYVSNLRKIALLGVDFSVIQNDILILSFMTGLFLIAAVVAFKIRFVSNNKNL